MASQVARIGTWEIDMSEERLVWSDITCALHDLPIDYEPDLETAINFYKEGESRDTLAAAVERGMTTGKGWDLELQLVTAEGREIWVHAIGRVEKNNDKVTRLYGTFQDIDRQTRARLELERVTSMLENTMAAATEVSFIATDLEGTITLFNHGSQHMLGYRAVDMVGKQTPAVLHVAEEMVARGMELSRQFGRPIEGFDVFIVIPNLEGAEQREWTYVHRDGRRFPVTLTVTPIRDQMGTLVGYLGIAQDISERKRLAENLAAAKQRLELAARAGGIGIWDWSVVDQTLTWDEQMFSLYGTDRPSFNGTIDDWLGPIHPDDTERFQADVTAALAGTRPLDTEFRVRHHDGIVRHLRAVAKVVRDEQGNAVRMVGSNWDVTDSVLRREELRVYAEKAQMASRAKSQFLATMSHEIRTPMNGVIGFCQLLLETHLNQEQRDYATSIRSSGQALLEIIDDILDISKIEAGKMRLDIQPIDLHRILGDTASLWYEQASHKRLSLTIDDQASADIQLNADATRTRQVLINLVGNALKFTATGSVTVRVRASHPAGMVRVEVEDTGIGISDDEQSRLFKNFSQADSSTTRRYGGTGLGLAISKHLVELMGGTIGFESQIGVGSTFWFTLPIAASNAADVQATTSETNTGTDPSDPITTPSDRTLSILVVDDNQMSRLLLKMSLQRYGHHIVTAHNGSDAVTKVFDAGPFDLVFMDCQMPDLDGFDAARMIRQKEAGCRDNGAPERVPIIAVTANAMSGDRERCLEAGMDDYLSKPIDHEALDSTLRAWSARIGDV